ncbi:hypothetical protein [Pseudomonas syringae]|uniref:hypothetical protein n=1 Tax=Pseudomonas syringae TaxID=317 RepID=UPI001F268505|nr:hypothetical protein [Pseudomonas syringae]MCF5721855.1 hypothetical protein [Pseudomonas syringae]
MQSEEQATGSEEQAAQEHHDPDGQGLGGLPTKAVKRTAKPRAIPGESIHCKRFIRLLQTDNVLTALMFEIGRDTHADYLVWDLASEVYSPEKLKQIFDELVQSGLYPLGRLAEELMRSFNRLRDPAPDMSFPSVAAACAAVKQQAKTRLAKGDYLWAILDPNTGRSPDRDGKGWDAMTDALLERMLSDRIPRALDMRFGRDLGL